MTTYELQSGSSLDIRSLPLFRDHPAIHVEKSGLLFSGNPSLRSWEAIGKQILSVAESSAWWIADWLAYGEDTFQDRYLEAIKRTSLSYQTLRNYVWVARRFELSRRRDTLSFGHHAEVAALESPEQDYWLRKAEEHGWSRNQLRSEVRASLRDRSVQPAPSASEVTGSDARNGTAAKENRTLNTLRLVLTGEQVALFESIASVRHLELHEWIMDVLEAAARNSDAPAGRRYGISPLGGRLSERDWAQRGSAAGAQDSPSSPRHCRCPVKCGPAKPARTVALLSPATS